MSRQDENTYSGKRIVVGISGASGAIYGVRALQVLGDLGVETHLVLSDGARATIALESEYTVEEVKALASVVHSDRNLAATISSGSYPVDGMLVAPCSIKTLAGIATTTTCSCARPTLPSRSAGRWC